MTCWKPPCGSKTICAHRLRKRENANADLSAAVLREVLGDLDLGIFTLRLCPQEAPVTGDLTGHSYH